MTIYLIAQNGLLHGTWLLVLAAVAATVHFPTAVGQAVRLTPQENRNPISLIIFGPTDKVVLSGDLGLALPYVVGEAISCDPQPGFDFCYGYSDYANLQTKHSAADNCTQFVWTSNFSRNLEDCFYLDPDAHWYGGGETNFQPWPIEGVVRQEEPMVTGGEYGSVAENFWLVSTGVAIHAEENVPLFISWGSQHEGKMCLSAQDKYPYKKRDALHLKYSICTGSDMKDVHLRALRKFYDVPPREAPDRTMILRPFWSTWAQYHREVNQSLVIEYGQRLRAEGFDLNSHLEVDDDWETCYGEAEFNEEKFPNVTEMVETLNGLGLKVTLWMHPFINYECPSFRTAMEQRYFAKAPNGLPGMISWWMGDLAGFVDYSNPEAVTWWKARLETIKQRYGIVSFKFDAGETSWLPYAYELEGDETLQPNSITTSYVRALASFGGMVEVGSGRRTQREALFTRMLDKDSSWGYTRGLRSLIPSVLHFGILGYPFALPDMIGGNAYNDPPTKELYVRWMQANTFMPAVQFSIVPWDFDAEVVQICKQMLALRERYAELIFKAVNESLVDGSPINRPMWWEDPLDKNTYTIDDQYMLGGDLVLAPVVDEGARSRNVYLPRGVWTGDNGVTYDGPQLITNYPAPLNTLPHFVKSTSTTPSGSASWTRIGSMQSLGLTFALLFCLCVGRAL